VRESVCERERVSECVCERERECVCERKRVRECVYLAGGGVAVDEVAVEGEEAEGVRRALEERRHVPVKCLREIQEPMSLKYEPASEPLHI